MKKNKLILALTLILTIALSIFADGEQGHGSFHDNGGGMTEMFCEFSDAFSGDTHP